MEKTRNWIIIIFAGLMGLSLIFFYAPGRSGALTAAGASHEVIASVSGDEITVGDLNQVKETYLQYQQMFGAQFGVAGRERQMLDGLISDRIIAQEAARLNLSPSDREVQDEIKKQFSPDGKFVGFERYKEQVLSRYGSLQKFEDQVRNSIANEKLRAFITAGVQVSEAEVQRDYERGNTTFDLVYVPVTVEQLAARINPSEEEMQKYYDEHQVEFRALEGQKKIRYVYIDQAKAGERVQISEEDLRAEYDKLSPENKMAGVNVQQIVLKVASPELDQAVLQKATELVARLRGGDLTATEEEFAEAARGNSEDPATAQQGGRLPAPVRKNPNRPNEILQSTLTMEPGQVGDPLMTGGAYYIFRRGDAVPKPFEDAKKEIEVSLRNRRSYQIAAQLAQRIADRLREVKDVQKVAEEFAAEANMNSTEMVRETKFIKPGDNVENIGSSPQFEEAIAPLNNVGDVGGRVSIKNGFAAPMLVERREPNVIPPFAEVREQAAERIRQTRAKEQLEQSARELAESAANPEALKAAAERLGLKAETAEAYKLGSPLGPAGTSPATDDAIYALKAGEVTKTPVKSGDTYVVLGATKRTDADLAEFGRQRDQLIETALTQRRTDVFGDYVASLRKRLERDGKVRIYEEVLARAIEVEEPPAATRPPSRPQLPTGK
jgi:peptidyl-prolyl cis-trans isomerase D